MTNYSAVEINGQLVSLGDVVKVLLPSEDGSEEHDVFGMAIVEELWEDHGDTDKHFAARWLYQSKDTVLKSMATVLCKDHMYAPDPRRVFLHKLAPVTPDAELWDSHGLDPNSTAVILGVCNCVCKMWASDEELAEADYFYDLSYDPVTMAFQDISDITPWPMKHADKGQPKKWTPQKQDPTPQTVRVCDVYAGTGGMGYLDTDREQGGKRVKIETKWAVDFDAAACESWRKNRPEVHTYHMSVDDFLFLVKKWDALSSKYDNWQPEDDDDNAEDEDEEEKEKEKEVAPTGQTPLDDQQSQQPEEDETATEEGGARRSSRVPKKVPESKFQIDDDRSRYSEWLNNAKSTKAKEKLQKRQVEATAKLDAALALAKRKKAVAPEELLADLEEAVKLATGAQLISNALERARKLLAEAKEQLGAQMVSTADIVQQAAKQTAADLNAAAEAERVLKESVQQSVAESEASGGGGTFIAAASAGDEKAGFSWKAEGEHGAGYYRDLSEEEKLRAAGVLKKKGADNWSWNVDMAYRVLADDVPVFSKFAAPLTDPPLAKLPLGFELSSKSGRRSTTGDEWLRVSKSSGIEGLDKVAWVPAKLVGKVLVEEVPQDEWDEESGEEDYEVEKIVEMRVKREKQKDNTNHPFKAGQQGKGEVGDLEFKIRWKGWDSKFDEWKTEEQLGCPEVVAAWVAQVNQRGEVPRPGDCELVCGGPPCQGVSGFNRFRNDENPLGDPKNRQMLIFYELVKTLRPTWSLLENVADIFKFPSKWAGIYGRFAVSRNIEMGYQARLGFLVAGAYGVPQYRLRCFIWGAKCGHPLPGFPMPTHRVVKRNTVMPVELKGCMVKAPPDRRLWREVRSPHDCPCLISILLAV
eukprot:COSAG01_NODE_179_length_22923_cov_25.190535_23_plen_867_part_00